MNLNDRRRAACLFALLLVLSSCGTAGSSKKPKPVDGFRFDLQPGAFALYTTTTSGNATYTASVRSLFMSRSDDPASKSQMLWIEHDVAPLSGSADLSVKKVKFLTPAKSWDAYLSDPLKNPLDIQQIDLQTEKEPISVLSRPEQIKIISTNFGPGFSVLKDFAQAVQKKADKPESITLLPGKYTATRYDFEVKTVERFPDPANPELVKIIETTNTGSLWAADEVPFGILKITAEARSKITYDFGKGIHIDTPAKEYTQTVTLELQQFGKDGVTLFTSPSSKPA